jgi:hypothetical protein
VGGLATFVEKEGSAGAVEAIVAVVAIVAAVVASGGGAKSSGRPRSTGCSAEDEVIASRVMSDTRARPSSLSAAAAAVSGPEGSSAWSVRVVRMPGEQAAKKSVSMQAARKVRSRPEGGTLLNRGFLVDSRWRIPPEVDGKGCWGLHLDSACLVD